MTFGPSWCQHQAKVQAAAERAAPRRAWRWIVGRKIFSMHSCRDLVGIERVRRDRAHAAGVKTLVAVERALVVHGGDHRHERLAVGKRQNRHLRPRQELLDHNAGGRSRRRRSSRIMETTASFASSRRLRDDNALAEGQTVRLHDDRHGGRVEIRKRRVQVARTSRRPPWECRISS